MRDACERDPRPIGARDLAIELIFSVTGCRRDALTKLNLASVERLPEAGCRAGERVFIVFHEKGNVVRQVPLSSDAAKALDRWLEVRGDWEGALFTPCSKSGQLLKGASAHRRLKPRAVNAMLDRRAKQAGIVKHLSPHDFRRTLVSDLLDGDVNLRDVQVFIGHADPATTGRYDRREKTAVMRKVLGAIEKLAPGEEETRGE